MHVTRLQAENVKKLRTVDVDLDEENAVLIRGPNGAGKSSILDAIWFALGGGRVHDDQVIREGEDEAHAIVELDGFRVKRTWTESGTYLKVTDSEGREYSSPQSLLDEFTTTFMFDPLEFLRLSAQEQRAKLLEVSGQRAALETLEQEREDRYDERRDVNREVRQLKGELEGFEDVDEALADAEVPSTSDLVADLDDAKEARDRKQTLKDNAEAKEQEAEKKRKRAQELLDRASALEEEAEESRTRASEIEVPDILELEQRVEEVDEERSRVQRAREKRSTRKSLEEKQAASKALTERLDAIEQEKEQILQRADLPEGVGFQEDQVTYQGRPLEQASMCEQLTVSMQIAMRMDPDLRILQVRDASLLDDASREHVIQAAEDADFQVFLEMVGTEGPASIVVEDGEVSTPPAQDGDA